MGADERMTAATRRIERIAVIGAGLMGHGIALELAAHGREVRLFDSDARQREQASVRVAGSLDLLVGSGNLTPAQGTAATTHLSYPADLETAVAEIDLVIEAVFEDLPTKQAVFRALDAAAPPDAILASNTSSYLPSALAGVTTRPERVIVTHYFNPGFLLPAVEIVPGPATAPEIIAAVFALYQAIGKSPVVLKREIMGFVANRLQAALLREALAIVEAGIASPTEVDTIIHTGFGRRLALAGVFEVRDLSGWPVSIKVHEDLVGLIDRGAEVHQTLYDIAAGASGDDAARMARRAQITQQLAALNLLFRDPEADAPPGTPDA